MEIKKDISSKIKHEIGSVYKYDGLYYLVIFDEERSKCAYVNLETGRIEGAWYENLDKMDNENQDDICVESLLNVNR